MIIMEQADLLDQAGMERAMGRYFADIQELCGDTINAMLNAKLHSCDFDAQTLTIQVETKRWMANPNGIVHGGILAACLDLVMGLLCRYCSGGKMTPTIHMDVDYLRSVPLGSTICVRAEVTHRGSKVCSAQGKLWVAGQEHRLLATASGTYFVH